MSSRLPRLLSRAGYGLGGAIFSVKEAAYSAFILLFYTQLLGLSGTIAGTALFCAVIVDCISDPVIGAWSDRLRSRWGRRHPFMVAGCVPMGFGFIGLFVVPDAVAASQAGMGLWLFFWSIWIRTTLSMFSIPHMAMSAEMTSDYRGRSAILAARLFFVFLFTVLIPATALFTLFDMRDGVDGRFVTANYAIYGFASAVLTWAIGLVSIWSTRRYAKPAAAEPDEVVTVLTGLRLFLGDFLRTLKVYNFRQLLAFDAAASVSYGVLISLHMLGNIYFWELDSNQIAIILAVPSLLGVSAAMLSIHWLGRRLAKHSILQASCGLLIIVGIWPYGLRLAGLMPDNGHPAIFWSLFAQMLLWMYLFILRAIAAQSLTADIADENDLAQGRRQEGALFAASTFASKLAGAIGPLYGGAVLDLVGLNRGMAPGLVPQATLDGLAIASVIGIMLPLLLALRFSYRVSMSEEQLQDIQAQLARRNAS